MKDRLITLLGGVFALYLVITLLIPPPSNEPPSSRAVSTDHGNHGLLGLKRWLEKSGVATKSLRNRYDELLADASLPQSGNLLIVHLPSIAPARDRERELLLDWLREGNNILVLMNVGEAGWLGTMTDPVSSDLGFYFAPADSKPKTPATKNAKNRGVFVASEPKKLTLLPNQSLPLLHGVQKVEVSSSSNAASDLVLRAEDRYRAAFILLREEVTDAPAFWQIRVGQGTGWISRYGSLLGNASLGDGDNAQLIANIVSATVLAGGKVIFDDMHQGVSDLYNPDVFFKDRRLHYTLLILVGFWLLYLVGRSNRLAPLNVSPRGARVADFTRAVGGLYARRLSSASVAQELAKRFFNEVRRRYHLPLTGEPVWEILQGVARVNRQDLGALQQIYSNLATTKPKLVQFARLIYNIRKSLT